MSFGYSVSIDGNTVMAGAPGYYAASGSAYIFEKSPTGWANTGETTFLIANRYAYQSHMGFSVAVSGNKMISGAPQYLNADYIPIGAAYFFEKRDNVLPIVANPVDGQLAAEAKQFSFTFSETTFFDEDDNVLVYTAKQSDNNPLPSWLSFDAANRTFSGKPAGTDVGNYTVRITADDQDGGVVFNDFNLEVVANRAPEIAITLKDTTAAEALFFRMDIGNRFRDLDGDPLSYTVSQTNNQPLPMWLAFNKSTLILRGTPGRADTISVHVRVSVHDGRGGTAQQELEIAVLPNHLPIVMQETPVQPARTGKLFEFSAVGLFSDPDNDSLHYRAYRTSRTELPAWLTFDQESLLLSGIPETGDQGYYSITIMVDDKRGGVLKSIVFIDVFSNWKPVVVDSIGRQSAQVEEMFEFIIPATTFQDNDEEDLAYTATLANGQPLPVWLNFNSETLAFRGTPQKGDEGTIFVLIKASDPNNAYVYLKFEISTENMVLGLADPELQARFNCYPNPTASHLTIDLSNADGGAGTITIFDLNMKVVKVLKLDIRQNQPEIMDVSFLAKGIYFVVLEFDRKKALQKIVKM